MNRSILARIGPAILACALIAWGAFFAWSWFAFPSDKFLPAFRAQYASRNALVLLFQWYVPVQAAAIVAASSLSSERRGGEAPPFARLASSAVVALVVLAAGYFALGETAGIGSERRLEELSSRSALARTYRAAAEQAERDRRWADAASAYERYLSIDPGNTLVAKKKLEDDTRGVEASAAQRKPAVQPPSAPAGIDAASLVKKAQYYFDREDWYSAHYYATQAAKLDPSRRDAVRLAARAMEKIASPGPSGDDLVARELYLQKKEAYDAFTRGEILAAYYDFLALAASHPKDEDVKEFLARSTAELQGEAFFLDELEPARALPGVSNLLFVNASDSSGTEAVWAGKMASVTGLSASGAPAMGTYLFDVEAIRWRRDGSVVWHFSAPYAKLEREPGQSDRLLLRAIDRGKSAVQYLPTWYAGRANRAPAELLTLALGPSVEDLPMMSIDRGSFSNVGIAELWRLREWPGAGTASGIGAMRNEIALELAMRAASPFILLAVSLLALAFGWSLRGRWAGRPPASAWLAMPLIGVAIAILTGLLLHAHRVALAFLVLAAGSTAALGALVALELALIAVSLAALAGQRSS